MSPADNFSSAINLNDHLAPTNSSASVSSISPSTKPPSPPSLASSQPDTAMAAAAVTTAAPSTIHDAQPPQQSDSRQDLPRPYKCPLCDKAFHRLEHQTRHIRTHTGEKPHACQFPGCQKRFSRSDELTRHSRIHSNPNSRRGRAANNVHAALAFAPGHPEVGGVPYMLAAPQPIQYPATAPSSQLASPNVSPPSSYVQYHSPAAYQTPPSYGSFSRSGYDSPAYTSHPTPERGINLLATAASQVEVERQRQSSVHPPPNYQPVRPHRHHTQHHHPYSGTNSPAGSRLPSISAYAYSSNSMSRSNSSEGHQHAAHPTHLEDPYTHAYGKRNRPPSPQYTNPASPNHSGCESCSDSHTPGHTPAITPAHSPRLRAVEGGSGVQLPGIRSLSLQQGYSHGHNGKLGVPETLEPTADVNHNTSHTNLVNSSYGATGGSPSGSGRASVNGSPTMLSAVRAGNSFEGSRSSSGMRISDIVHSDAGQGGVGRTLPVPTMSTSHSGTSTPHGGSRTGVQWMLNAEGVDDADRMDES